MKWCERFNLPSLPTNEETFAVYLTNLAHDGKKTSTIQRRMSAITRYHIEAGFPSPKTKRVKIVWAGIRRDLGTAEIGKLPVEIDTLKLMLNELPDSLIGIRDRSILLIGFAGALRRSEIVKLDIGDLKIVKEGLVLNIRHSKTDQEGKGESIAIPYGSNEETCPVRAFQAWIRASNIAAGPLYRSINRHHQINENRLSDRAVALIVKRYIEAIGLDERLYSGHSLRSGLATTAAMSGKSERSIMAQTRHRSEAMVRKYIRMGSLFVENAAADIGL